jgi:hypothetical protein
MKKLLPPLIAALVIAAPAAADIGWYAKWREAPVGLKVSGIEKFPAADQEMIRAAMADWSASPVVDLVEAKSGKVRMEVCDGCGFLTRPNRNNGVLHGATIQIDRQWLGQSFMRGVYCHELGHGLGLGEGYPVEQTGDFGSCMADSGQWPTPSQMDFDVLSAMYGG